MKPHLWVEMSFLRLSWAPWEIEPGTKVLRAGTVLGKVTPGGRSQEGESKGSI
jgi:hypothetical protein